MEIAREIADGVKRQNAFLDSADMMSIEQLRIHVQDWRKECKTVDELISWRLFPERAARTLAEFPDLVHMNNRFYFEESKFDKR